MYKEQFKRIATEFFFWWYNSKGSNTYQGFDDWTETERGKLLMNNMVKEIEDSKMLKHVMIGICIGILSSAVGLLLFKVLH